MAKEKIYLEDLGNSDIIFRNFRGEADKYNDKGRRMFTVIIRDEKLAKKFDEEGWRISWKENQDGDPVARLKVNVSYRFTEPKIVLISDGKKSLLKEDDVAKLDGLDYKTVDMVVNGSWFEDRMSAYLDEMYVTVEESIFAKKYADIPEVGGCGHCDICDKGCEDGYVPFDM